MTVTSLRRLPPSATALLAAARAGVDAAAEAAAPVERYAAAHLAALRAAAAVLAVRAAPAPRRRPTSAWALLPAVAPALSEWAAFFAAGAPKRAAAEAGLRRAVTAREADDLLRDVTRFVALAAAEVAGAVADQRTGAVADQGTGAGTEGRVEGRAGAGTEEGAQQTLVFRAG